ncbi:VOC family protein [Sphingobacterium sp. SYP-B4668]|uniref:VOC family protein n=1 Tax=Sphingobacterium sp. SYP-B4668 TaxID=2996035 RepID=UPI0022DD5B09|nr:VOC family protein [Sphingobacterium sp. SYP-B4668]
MNPKMIWANLAVDDLERTQQFYSELGFRINGSSKELTSVFFGDNSFVINFFVKDVLREAMKGELADTNVGGEVIFTLSAESKDDVDRWAEEVERVGGTVVSRPEEFGKGYYGFVFSDPHGHRFNVFFM